MSSSHHDDHHTEEQKPIAFTVPFILASVLILIIVMFLSLCDPKPHHGHEAGHNEHTAPTEAAHHNDATMEAHPAAAAAETGHEKAPAAAETAPAAEQSAHEHH